MAAVVTILGGTAGAITALLAILVFDAGLDTAATLYFGSAMGIILPVCLVASGFGIGHKRLAT